MSGLVIRGCEFDAGHVKDVIYGNGFRMELDRAVELVEAGVEFSAEMPDGSLAQVFLSTNDYGEPVLRTEAGALAANHLGEITAPPIVHKRYRAEAHIPAEAGYGYAVAA